MSYYLKPAILPDVLFSVTVAMLVDDARHHRTQFWNCYWDWLLKPLLHWDWLLKPLLHWDWLLKPLLHWDWLLKPLLHGDWLLKPLLHWDGLLKPLLHGKVSIINITWTIVQLCKRMYSETCMCQNYCDWLLKPLLHGKGCTVKPGCVKITETLFTVTYS